MAVVDELALLGAGEVPGLLALGGFEPEPYCVARCGGRLHGAELADETQVDVQDGVLVAQKEVLAVGDCLLEDLSVDLGSALPEASLR